MPDTPDDILSGGLVPLAPSRSNYDSLIEKHSRRTGLDPELVRRVAGQESRFRSNAVSPKGAGGVMQLMPATAASLGVKNRFDPDENIRAGTDYLKQQLDKFGDVNLALAAYNAGPGAVEKYGNKVPPYAETQNYVKRIAGGYQGTGYAGQSPDILSGGLIQRKPNISPTTPDILSGGLVEAQPVVPRSRQPRPPKIINPNDLNAQLLSALQKAQGPAVEAGAKVGQPSVAQETRGGLRGLAQMAGAPTGYMGDVGDWVNEAVAAAVPSIIRKGAAVVDQTPQPNPIKQALNIPETLPQESPDSLANRLRAKAGELQGQTQAASADRSGLSRFGQGLVTQGVEMAPALILHRLGVATPVAFAINGNLEARGEKAKATEIMTRTLQDFGIGALNEIPLPVKQELLSAIQQRLLRAGIMTAGTAAITGDPTSSLVMGGFGLAEGTKLPESAGSEIPMRPAPEPLQRGAQSRLAPPLGANAPRIPEGAEPAFFRGGKQIVQQGDQLVMENRTEPVRHVDLQPRDEAGQFREETPLETESRRAQVASSVSQPAAEITPPQPATVAPVAEPSTSLPPTTPEMGTPKLARGVEAKAVQAKLTQSFEGLPEYQKVNVADQAQRAVDLLKNDPQRAREIAMGRDMPDGDLTPEAVFTAVENHALKNGDVDTLRDLATASTRPLEATAMGQRLRLLAERNPSSAVSAIRDVEMARQARAQKQFGKNGEGKIKSEIQMELRKSAPKVKDWSSFLDSIRC